MKSENNLSVVICTRNRPVELKRCIESISRQKIDTEFQIEVLIIDDGQLSNEIKNEFVSKLSKFEFKYYKKECPGLFLSRIFAVSVANSNIILFLDDDVEIEDELF